jgi:hypothetical protein
MRLADEFVEVVSTPTVLCGFCLTSESVIVVVAAGPNLRIQA